VADIDKNELKNVAEALVAPTKGILAADESSGTIKKRFASINIESSPETNRKYRLLLFTTEGIEKYISGVILFDETIKQSTDEGTPLTKLLSDKGIIPGIKVDLGKESFSESPDEYVTKGLDGLSERLVEYKQLGALFAKWRAVFKIGDGQPSELAIDKNSDLLASYALACQENGIVPIVEPEVLMDGLHDINTCRNITYKVLKTVFTKLTEFNVYLEGILLKPNMVTSGKDLTIDTPEEVSSETFAVFSEVIPDNVPGVVFLSGGQSPEQACSNLNELNKRPSKPWELSFSFGRALQQPVLSTWTGKDENILAAQKEFVKRAKLTSLARQGKYTPDMENK
jgi:fructose-bisphosphate aldolase, class I